MWITQWTRVERSPGSGNYCRWQHSARPAPVSRFTERTPWLHHSVRLTLLVFTTVRKRAFVLRLTPEARPIDGKFQGRVEEVDSGRNVKFGSMEKFLDFLQQCLQHQLTLDE